MSVTGVGSLVLIQFRSTQAYVCSVPVSIQVDNLRLFLLDLTASTVSPDLQSMSSNTFTCCFILIGMLSVCVVCDYKTIS